MPTPMADSTTIRVDRDVHEDVKAIAENEGLSLANTLRRLVEQHRRDRLFARADRVYRRLREDVEDWDDVEVEREEIQGAQGDGLEDEYGETCSSPR